MTTGLVKVGGQQAAGARFVRRIQHHLDWAAGAHARIDSDLKARLKSEVEDGPESAPAPDQAE